MAADRAGGITKQQFEKIWTTPEEAWTAFWRLADEDEAGHYLWRGPVDKEGRAVFVTKKEAQLPAAEIAWVYDGHQPSVDVAPACRRKHCINPQHLAVQGAA